jgi:mannose-6-phosphate isomerase-like protein (cupin superfamily)
MKSTKEYIESGILEMYVLGHTSEVENLEIQHMANTHPEIRDEIESISESLIQYAETEVKSINPTIKPMVMAIIDYTERMMSGEIPAAPPILNERSKISDYSQWLDNKSMQLPLHFEDLYAKIIGNVEGAMTAIVWIKDSSPYEVHDTEYEKFLIVEGTCDIVTENKTYSLVPGDYLTIPLHLGHEVKVTSDVPCKVILQRVAA